MMRASYFRPFPLLFLAAILVTLAVLVVHDTPPAQAQAVTPITLVSNTGKSQSSSGHIGPGWFEHAQCFTTGSHSGGYTLSSIIIRFANVPSSATAELWSAASSGAPDSKDADLASPASLSANSANSFSASAGTTLDASTTYCVVVRGANDVQRSISNTNSNDEDSGAATGWSIANNSWFRNHGSTNNWMTFSQVRRIRVNGNEVALGPTDLSDLTAESSSDGSNFAAITTPEPLSPAFDADTTSYTATVADTVTHARLTPTVGDSTSTVEVGKDGSLETVASGTASNAIALDVGDNEIIVRVTASDSTTQDYTVNVRRGTIWSATLTPGQLGTFIGCFDSTRCSEWLTDGNFSVGGQDYSFSTIFDADDGSFSITVSHAINTALSQLNFCVGSTDFALSAASISESDRRADWSNANLVWTVGTPVSLSIGTSCAQTLSSDATLSDLTALSHTSATGTFSPLALTPPTFNAATTGYTATVANTITHAKLTPTANHASATIQVGKGSTLANVNSGQDSDAIALDVGANAITVRVTAQDTTTTQNYTVTIIRAPADQLVSNMGQAPGSLSTTDTGIAMQGFTTGSATAGYTLTSIEAVIEAATISTSQRNTIRAELWSAASGGGPDSKVADLTVPASVSTGTVTFTDPANTVLTSGTEYFFTLYTTGSFDLEIDITESNGEDAGSQAGWSISDTFWYASQNTPSGATWTEQTNPSFAFSYRLRVKGSEAQAQSSDADLSALTGTPCTSSTSCSGALTLTPAFNAATTSYTATVANTVTHVKLTPTVNHSAATVAVGGSPVTTATASQAIAVNVGSNNVITVRVTAEDTTTKDYTVTITREEAAGSFLVSNLAQTTGTSLLTGSYSVAQGFTTGSHSGGYTLTSIEAVIEAATISTTQRNTIRAELWSAASGGPDSKLYDLTVPSTVSTGTVSFAAPTNTNVSASTTYYAVFYTVGSFSMDLDVAASDDEDSGSAAGWTIGNGFRNVEVDVPLSTSTWSAEGTDSVRIAVKGSEGQAHSPTDLSALTGNTCTSSSSCTGPLTLSPAFDAATTSYTATVANTITHVTVTPTVAVTGSLVLVTQVVSDPEGVIQVASGTASHSIALNVGANTIIVQVTTADLSNDKNYTVTITRQGAAQSSDADLSALTGTPCTSSTSCSGALALSPAFNAATTSYTATVANNITHAGLTPTVNHSAATVTVNGMAVNSGTPSDPIALSVGANAVTVRVTAQDTTTRAYTVTITRLAIQVEDWSSTLHVKGAGGSNAGCRNDVGGARCSDPSVLTSDEFDYTRYIYGEPYTRTFRVEDLYRTSITSQNKLVLVANQRLLHTFRGFVLTVLDPRPVPVNDEPPQDNTTPMRFPFDKAVIDGNRATWDYNGMSWFPGLTRPITLGMERPRATLDTIEIYYDGITADAPGGVDGFVNWAVATPAVYGYRVNIPGEFPSIDPDKGVVQVTHARLKVHAEHPGSVVRIRKVAYDSQGNNPTPGSWTTVTRGDLTSAIELNAHSHNTRVDIEVTDGSVVRTYLLNIDPPPRTYSLSPRAHVVEGQEALLTLTLSQPAPAGGVEFTVTAGHGTAGADDLGAIASPVTVPEGASSLAIAVPTVDDDRHEGEESFTVTVAPARFGWGVASLGTDTATVTIVDNDDPPLGPEPRTVRVVPGDGALTVSWTVAPRDGVADGEIRHALRWSQQPGVWANPKDPRNIGRNDGITVAGGTIGYVITGLENGVATGVFVRSYTGDDHSESSTQSSRWVRVKGKETTPRGEEQQQAEPARTYSVTATTSATEGGGAALTITLGQAAPADGVEFSVTVGYSGGSTATASDVGAVASPVTVAQGNTTLAITIPTAEDAVDEEDETFTVTIAIAAATAGWERDGDGRDTATVTIEDDDTAGITVTAASPLNMAEGGTATYTVVLDSQPTANVTVTAGSGDSGAATVSPASHTFTPSTWNAAATFTVSGIADDDSDDESVSVSHRAASPDGKYANLPVAAVTVSVSDTTPEEKYAGLIARMKEWRNDPCCVDNQEHTGRWDRALLAFGETVADQTLTKMTAAEAQGYADNGWTRWVEVAKALKEIEGGGPEETPNRAPTVSGAIADAVIVNESGTETVSLSGVFSDADNDALTVAAASSDEAVATVSVASGYASLTVTARARGMATITVTADDGNGGTVSDEFTITVKAAPVVASAISDISGLEAGDSQDVSLSGVFSDADGDSLTITAASSDDARATVTVASDGSKLTVAGVAEGAATVTVTARDGDGNRVSDTFDVPVAKKYAGLIARMKEWRNDPCCVDNREHTGRWDRALLAFGETVADTSLTKMTASEAQDHANKGWSRWVEVAKALKELEGG